MIVEQVKVGEFCETHEQCEMMDVGSFCEDAIHRCSCADEYLEINGRCFSILSNSKSSVIIYSIHVIRETELTSIDFPFEDVTHWCKNEYECLKEYGKHADCHEIEAVCFCSRDYVAINHDNYTECGEKRGLYALCHSDNQCRHTLGRGGFCDNNNQCNCIKDYYPFMLEYTDWISHKCEPKPCMYFTRFDFYLLQM